MASQQAVHFDVHSDTDRLFVNPDDQAGELIIYNKLPLREILLAVSLLLLGCLFIVLGVLSLLGKLGDDKTNALTFLLLGGVIFLPGFYATRIAYYSYKGFQGFSFDNIPLV